MYFFYISLQRDFHPLNISKDMKKRLTKSADKMLAGVCGGIADYYDIDSTLVRIGFVLIAFMTAVMPMVVLYIIMSCVMPSSQFE